jgi:hypothetical protein
VCLHVFDSLCSSEDWADVDDLEDMEEVTAGLTRGGGALSAQAAAELYAKKLIHKVTTLFPCSCSSLQVS